MFGPHKIAFLHESDYHNNLMEPIIWIRKRIWRYHLPNVTHTSSAV